MAESKMPERLWASLDIMPHDLNSRGNWIDCCVNVHHTEYIRADIHEAVLASRTELYEALEAWNNWHYEVMSARVNGESIYGSADFDRMKADAQRLTDAALAKARGEK